MTAPHREGSRRASALRGRPPVSRWAFVKHYRSDNNAAQALFWGEKRYTIIIGPGPLDRHGAAQVPRGSLRTPRYLWGSLFVLAWRELTELSAWGGAARDDKE